MWTLQNVKTVLDSFLGPIMTPATFMLNLKRSRQPTTESFSCSKISLWEKQFSSSSCDWATRWPLQQKTSAESKTCPQCWYQHCPQTWMNNANWLTRQKEKLVWLCCGTLWKNQRIHFLNSHYLQGGRRTKSFNKLIMWTMNLKNFSIYLLWWILYVIEYYYWTHLHRPIKSNCNCLFFIFFLSIRVRMSWNIGGHWYLFLKLKSNMALYQVVLPTPKTSSGKLT